MNLETIVILCLFIGAIIFIIVRAVVALVRAKHAGIVRFIPPHETDFFLFGIIMLILGICVSAGELILASMHKDSGAGAIGLLYAAMSVWILLLILTNGAFVTKTGIQPLKSYTRDVFSAKIRGKWIILYNSKTEKILLKIRANDKNLQLFQPGELPL